MSSSEQVRGWVPYVVPYAAFAGITWAGSTIPGALALSYPLKTVAVAGLVLWFFRRGAYPELSFRPSLLGILVGVVGFALWVYPEELLASIPKLGSSRYDPAFAGESWRLPLLLFRVGGAVLLVPIFEELFLRSFLIRWVDTPDGDFREAPLGVFRPASFLVVVAAMALTHDRWLRAAAYSALVTLLLYREKRLGPVIWAHAVTNALLAAYVIHEEAWTFW